MVPLYGAWCSLSPITPAPLSFGTGTLSRWQNRQCVLVDRHSDRVVSQNDDTSQVELAS